MIFHYSNCNRLRQVGRHKIIKHQLKTNIDIINEDPVRIPMETFLGCLLNQQYIPKTKN